MQDAATAPPPRYKAIKRRIRGLRTHAAPGPSSWRNGLIQDVASSDAGVAALSGWATMWRLGRVTDATVALWTAAVVSPIDSGWLGRG